MQRARVLVAGVSGEQVAAGAATLRAHGHETDTAADAAGVFDSARAARHDLILLDLDGWAEDGLDLLRAVKREHPSQLVVLIATPTAVETAITGFRSGAMDFLLKPVVAERLDELAQRAHTLRDKGERRRRLSEELSNERDRVRELRRRLAFDDPFQRIVGSSAAMRNLADTLREVARTDSTVLLTGESGTGKGVAARAIHDASARADGAFVEANCVVYSEGVLHSELFGHEKGAFTGATRQKKGRFELAYGGTLLLDEIGEISPATQLMLLRVLQERTFERVGGEETLEADVRLLAATNRDLSEAMRRGEFRSDLFFRLNVIPVQLPPLREHPEDVPALAQHFLRTCAERMGRPVEGFSPDAIEALAAHRWPGNIRELENMVERMVVLCRAERIELEDVPAALRAKRGPGRTGAGRRLVGTLEEIERRRILEVLRETAGNKKAAAERLGIHRSTLYAKLKRHGLGADQGDADRRDPEQELSETPTRSVKVGAGRT